MFHVLFSCLSCTKISFALLQYKFWQYVHTWPPPFPSNILSGTNLVQTSFSKFKLARDVHSVFKQMCFPQTTIELIYARQRLGHIRSNHSRWTQQQMIQDHADNSPNTNFMVHSAFVPLLSKFFPHRLCPLDLGSALGNFSRLISRNKYQELSNAMVTRF